MSSSGSPGVRFKPTSLAIGLRERPFHQMAVSALNGLVGSNRFSGGVLIPKQFPTNRFLRSERSHRPKRPCDGKNRWDHRYPNGGPSSLPLAKNVLSGKPYKPAVLFLYYTNPLFSNPNPDLFAGAFAEDPRSSSAFRPTWMTALVMQTSSFLTNTPLERWQDDPLFLNNGPTGSRHPPTGSRTDSRHKDHRRYS